MKICAWRRRRAPHRFGHRVRRFERRNDAFGAREQARRRQRFGVATPPCTRRGSRSCSQACSGPIMA